jgi:hypothetical protein
MRKFSPSLATIGLLLAAACGEKTATPGGTPEPEGGSGGSEMEGGSGGSGGKAGSGGAGGAKTGGSGGGAAGSGGSSAPPDAGTTSGSADAAAARADAAPPVAADPNAPCPRCVKIFNGMNFDGWEASSSTWSIQPGGVMRGIGGTSRAAYTKADYGNVRLIVTSRMNPVNGDHLGILFWGDRPTDPERPKIDNAGWVQWMPPFGGMWSYHPPMHHGLRAMKVGTAMASNTEWHTSELLLNLDKGTLRAAVNGVEISRYTHEWPTERVDPTKRIIRGPLAMFRHGRGGSEYKDIYVEDEPTEDVLYTVKKQ